jgi:hypothetical protein
MNVEVKEKADPAQTTIEEGTHRNNILITNEII